MSEPPTDHLIRCESEAAVIDKIIIFAYIVTPCSADRAAGGIKELTISLMQILMAGNYDDDNSDRDDYVETGGRLRCGRHLPLRPVRDSTNTGGFAVELLQMQSSATIDTIHDCRLGDPCGSRRIICQALFQVVRSDKIGEASFGLAESADPEP
jgi:hypothetical protein